MIFSSFFASLVMSFFFVILLQMVSYFISFKFFSTYDKKVSYECGFDPLSSNRSSTSLGFFLVCVIFVLFSVEVVLIFPAVNSVCYWAGEVYLLNLWVFLFILLAGLFYEWFTGSLEWFS
uniref:NADH dehydrogenase subunit 3 n=1 Tax=Cardita variegata TaxID=740991 RepID=UPI00286C4E78|nr:NADH dehydrogenase subunit 3 [Cardita variegata]WLW42342.1 NADH dehydrogenase subunit 3 [Cardita variegata]